MSKSNDAGEVFAILGVVLVVLLALVAALCVLVAVICVGLFIGSGVGLANYGKAFLANVEFEKPHGVTPP